MVSPLDSFGQFLLSFFLFFIDRERVFIATLHHHASRSTKAHSSKVSPTRITRYPSITMSFPFADRMPRDLPFSSFSRSTAPLPHCNFPTRFLHRRLLLPRIGSSPSFRFSRFSEVDHRLLDGKYRARTTLNRFTTTRYTR